MTDTVTITGLKELQARLKTIANDIGEKGAQRPLTNALRKAGRVLIKAAQENLRRGNHVLSGTLVNNIVTKKVKSNPGEIRIHVGIRSNAQQYKDNKANRRAGRVGGKYQNYGPLFYGRFLEFGTSHQVATPFLRPAFEANKDSLPELVRDDVIKRLDKL